MRLVSFSLCIAVLTTAFTTPLFPRRIAQAESKQTLKTLGCSTATQESLNRLLGTLPSQLSTQVSQLKVACSDRIMPFGFELTERGAELQVALGEVSPKMSRRARYRLDHLTERELTELWHQRALVHALLLKATSSQRWHLDPRFRSVNGWSLHGEEAVNRDLWGYSRQLGQRSALDDFLTFGEEWFVRPPRRQTSPDNRVECQSFSKSRFFDRLFSPQSPDIPAQHCEAFWRWRGLYRSAEIIFTSPTSSPISSFGHLALLLRSEPEVKQPEYLDPVFQYVGLVSIENGRKSLIDSLLNEIPLIVQASTFSRFDSQNRLREDRRLYRFKVKLSPEDFTWLAARLWEQLRRFQSSYHFLTQNCAEIILQLFEQITDQNLPSQPGVSTSPLGVLSILQREGVIDEKPLWQSSLSEELAMLKEAMSPYLDLRKAREESTPPLESLNEINLERWLTFLKTLSASDQEALPFLHHAQDYFDLAVWKTRVRPTQLAPLKSPDLLALKHELLHEEKYAEQILEKTDEWFQEYQRQEENAVKRSQRELLEERTDKLSEAIGEKIEDLGIEDRVISPLEESTQVLHGEPTDRPWGDNSSLVLGLSTSQSGLNRSAQLSFTLYDETQGYRRSVLREPDRDLKWMAVSLTAHAQGWADLYLRPISYYSRSGLLNIDRWGGLLDFELGNDGKAPFMRASVGSSAQLLCWDHKRGDLSLGVRARSQIQRDQDPRVHLPYVMTLTLPLWRRALFKTTLWRDAWRSDSRPVSEGLALSLDLAYLFGDHQTFSVISQVDYERDRGDHLRPRYTLMLRLQ